MQTTVAVLPSATAGRQHLQHLITETIEEQPTHLAPSSGGQLGDPRLGSPTNAELSGAPFDSVGSPSSGRGVWRPSQDGSSLASNPQHPNMAANGASLGVASLAGTSGLQPDAQVEQRKVVVLG